jgi:hypothetical protein
MRERTFLTQKELSDRWRLSSRTLEGWRVKGIGPTYVRIGSRVIYSVEAVLKFEEAGVMLGVPNHG